MAGRSSMWVLLAVGVAVLFGACGVLGRAGRLEDPTASGVLGLGGVVLYVVGGVLVYLAWRRR